MRFESGLLVSNEVVLMGDRTLPFDHDKVCDSYGPKVQLDEGDTMSHRIGCSCYYEQNNTWRKGTLLSWSTDHEEYESGPGLFPVGVIEDSVTHTCHSIYVNAISFGSEPSQ